MVAKKQNYYSRLMNFHAKVQDLSMPNLTLHNICANDGTRTKLEDVSFSLSAGESLGIIGTDEELQVLLHILLGNYANYTGSVFLCGERLDHIRTIHSTTRMGIQFFLSHSQLMLNLNAVENIMFSGSNIILSRKKEQEICEQVLNFLGLRMQLDVPLKRLTRQDQLLVVFLKTLVALPRVVIMTGFNDLTSETLGMFRNIMHKFHEKGTAFLLLSSRLDDVLLELATTVCSLQNGKLGNIIAVKKLRQNPKLIAQLTLGAPIDISSQSVRLPITTLNALQNINQILFSRKNHEQIMRFLAEQISLQFGNQPCCIRKLNPQTLDTEIRTSYLSSDFAEGSLAARARDGAILSQSPVYGIEQKGVFFMFEIGKDMVASCNFVFLPITNRNGTAGLIELYFDEERALSGSESFLLHYMANQYAIVIENERLTEQSSLIQEAHHRIKNNLQSIVSLLYLQMNINNDTDTNGILKSAVSRIKAIATVHDQLSHEYTISGVIDIYDLTFRLIRNLDMEASARNVKIDLDSIHYLIPYSYATSILLIINELISNCLKHAFPNKSSSGFFVHVKASQTDKELLFDVRDNGSGLPSDFREPASYWLGLKIVSAIAESIHARFSISTSSGTIGRLAINKCFITEGE